MIPRNGIVVYTDEYKIAHGVSPKGNGYWHFVCKGRVVMDFQYIGMYKEAKKGAIDFAAENNCCVVLVKP